MNTRNITTRLILTTLAALALILSQAPAEGAAPDKTQIDFVMDLGSVQLDATAIRRNAVTGYWKPIPQQIGLLIQSAARARTFPGTTPDQKPLLDTLQRDALALRAASAARNAVLTGSAALAVSADATAIVAHGPRLLPGAPR